MMTDPSSSASTCSSSKIVVDIGPRGDRLDDVVVRSDRLRAKLRSELSKLSLSLSPASSCTPKDVSPSLSQTPPVPSITSQLTPA